MEDRETRLKRLRIRSWRRGMKEMDLILGPFSDGPLRAQGDDLLNEYEALLDENDQDLYLWITARTQNRAEGPEALARVMDEIAGFAASRLSGN
ncbi:MAG: succinate dehydrogenase assembly factor 2 [Paracoccus sp. (in: a-proteobacteria)]|nr:succinate dehydrogenase assembly factor 2 [Paracoccus sp. (in: a-proteobacteria)]